MGRGWGDCAADDRVKGAHLVDEAGDRRAQAGIFCLHAPRLLGAARQLGHEVASDPLRLLSQLLERPLPPLIGSLQPSFDVRIHVLEQLL